MAWVTNDLKAAWGQTQCSAQALTDGLREAGLIVAEDEVSFE
jgi:hypothetical protein